MRLIDADALKEEINKKKVVGRFNTIMLIDNAPTVDALPREYHDRVLDMTVAELQACQANLRPQGEWIIVKDEKYGDYVKCPFCGKELAGTDLYFCVNCGAKMKGGTK